MHDNSNPTSYENRYYDGQETLIREVNNRISKETPIDIWVGKVDYSMNLAEKVSMETGVKGTFTKLINDIIFEEQVGENWVIGEEFSNYADLSENILASFATIMIKFNEKTSLNAGLRYEHTTTVLNTEESWTVNMGIFSHALFLKKN